MSEHHDIPSPLSTRHLPRSPSKRRSLSHLLKRNVLALSLVSLGLSLGAACIGCQASDHTRAIDALKNNQSGDQSAERPALIEVTDESDSLLFIYRDAQQREQRAMSRSEIPESSRERVFVVDLKRSPQERQARGFVQVFDLRAPDANGHYRGEVVKRELAEQELASRDDEKRRAREVSRRRAQRQKALQAQEGATPQFSADHPQPEIILYSTSWCGYCKKARAFLKSRGLKFTELDVGEDRSAARALARKSKRAGIDPGGVPVIEVGGQLISGFDPNRILSALQSVSQSPRTR